MRLSARNQLPGRVTAIRLGTVMAEVTIDIGGHTLVSAITRGSAEALGLREATELPPSSSLPRSSSARTS